jgi:hypothetical protein
LEDTKDVTVRGKNYRIKRLTAMVGAWMIRALPNSSEDDFKKIQTYCLKACSRIEPDGTPSPILMEDGRWVAIDLEYDTISVMELEAEVIKFNLADFFVEGASTPAKTQ